MASVIDNLRDAFNGTGYAGGAVRQQVDIVAVSGSVSAADNAESVFDDTGFGMSQSAIGTAAAIGNIGALNLDAIKGTSFAQDIEGTETIIPGGASKIWSKVLVEPTAAPPVTASVADAMAWILVHTRNAADTDLSNINLKTDIGGALASQVVTDTGADSLTLGEWT